jgi:hypothetical protein
MEDSSFGCALIDVAITSTPFLDDEELVMNKNAHKTTMRTTAISLIFFFKLN